MRRHLAFLAVLSALILGGSPSAGAASQTWTKAHIAIIYVPVDEKTWLNSAPPNAYQNLQEVTATLASHAPGKLRRDLLALSKDAHAFWATRAPNKMHIVVANEERAEATVNEDLGVTNEVKAFISAQEQRGSETTTTAP
jgi:hypothetical protein